MTVKELEEMQQVKVNEINPDELIDINEIQIDSELPKHERIKEFISAMGNPYIFKCDGIIVKNSFINTDCKLEEQIRSYLESIIPTDKL